MRWERIRNPGVCTGGQNAAKRQERKLAQRQKPDIPPRASIDGKIQHRPN